MRAPVFVLARSNGTGLYGLRDIAYTLDKMKYGKNIIVLGEDQKLYFQQLSAALSILMLSGSLGTTATSVALSPMSGESPVVSKSIIATGSMFH